MFAIVVLVIAANQVLPTSVILTIEAILSQSIGCTLNHR